MSKGRIQKQPTPKQKKAVDNVLSGEFTSFKPALKDAGYSDSTSAEPQKNFLKAQGVQVYLKKLDKKAQKRFGMELHEKVADTYLDGLEATKLYGKDGTEHPDSMARLAYADRFAKFFGWVSDGETQAKTKNQQFNFFSTSGEEKENFNNSFIDFLKEASN